MIASPACSASGPLMSRRMYLMGARTIRFIRSSVTRTRPRFRNLARSARSSWNRTLNFSGLHSRYSSPSCSRTCQYQDSAISTRTLRLSGLPLVGQGRLGDLAGQRAGDVPRPVRAGRVGDLLRQLGREGPAAPGERGPLGRVEPDGDAEAHRRLVAVDVEIQLAVVFEEIPPGGL